MATEPPGVAVAGGELRRLRKLSGDNLRVFAAKVGVSLQYVSQIETGARKSVSPQVFASICNTLGIEPAERSRLVDEACNCQAVPGTENYPGPWHIRGDAPHYPCASGAA
jgi:transcriptional regulator with XRE-family HTH domain